MTKDSIPSPIAMPSPFAGGAGAAVTDVVTGAAQPSNVSFLGGFGANYSAPASGGGKYLTREEMNGFGLAATTDIFRHKCGAVNTFDPAFCAKIGGYPEGAVLDYIVGDQLFKVRSNVDNNTYDFITNGMIGQDKWSMLNMPIPEEAQDRTVFSYREGYTPFEVTADFIVTQVGVFKADKSGAASVFIENDESFFYPSGAGQSYNHPLSLNSVRYFRHCYGSIFIKDLGEEIEQYALPSYDTNSGVMDNNGFVEIPLRGELGDYKAVSGALTTTPTVTFTSNHERSGINIIAGHYYSVVSGRGVVYGKGNAGSSSGGLTFPPSFAFKVYIIKGDIKIKAL